jgi:hypothetical protein
MIVKIINGKDIPFKEVMGIRQIRANAFWDGIIKEERKVPFNEETLFIIHDKQEKIMAVGCLFPIEAKFLKRFYTIQGIWNIVSIQKGKWYGKILMQAIYSYLKKKKITGLWFCSPTNTAFYKKCNFLIQNNRIDRFINTSGIGRQPPADEDILYREGKDQFIKKFLSHPKAKVYIPRFW